MPKKYEPQFARWWRCNQGPKIKFSKGHAPHIVSLNDTKFEVHLMDFWQFKMFW